MSNSFLIPILIILIVLPILVYLKQRYNMTYYKLYGRTQLEIESWIKKQKWYQYFINEITNSIWEEYKNSYPEDIKERMAFFKEEAQIMADKVKEFVSGSHDKNTISEAFSWAESILGTKYWGKVEYKFLKWYFGQYIDFHLFK